MEIFDQSSTKIGERHNSDSGKQIPQTTLCPDENSKTLASNIILRLLDVDDKFLEFWVFFAFFARTCREYLTTVS